MNCKVLVVWSVVSLGAAACADFQTRAGGTGGVDGGTATGAAGGAAACADGGTACDGAAGCQCVDQGAASCGTDGNCDGDGACQMYASGTVCVPASCYVGKVTLASTCDGAGTCTAGGVMACLPYNCSGDACLTSCANDADCAGSPQDPPYCSASGQCEPRQLPGAPCTSADQCYTSNCDDGVCCIEGCNGTCNTCAAAGTVGECGVEPAGANNPNHPCPNGGVCNGVGGTTASCVQCVADDNCADPTPICDVATGTCVACCLFPSGEPCTTGTQCASGVCTSPGNTCM
jgi:hypothetical protein